MDLARECIVLLERINELLDEAIARCEVTAMLERVSH